MAYCWCGYILLWRDTRLKTLWREPTCGYRIYVHLEVEDAQCISKSQRNALSLRTPRIQLICKNCCSFQLLINRGIVVIILFFACATGSMVVICFFNLLLILPDRGVSRDDISGKQKVSFFIEDRRLIVFFIHFFCSNVDSLSIRFLFNRERDIQKFAD